MFQKMWTFGDSPTHGDRENLTEPGTNPEKDQRSKNRRLKDKKSLYRKSRNQEINRRPKKTKINKRKAKSRRFKDQDQMFFFFF